MPGCLDYAGCFIDYAGLSRLCHGLSVEPVVGMFVPGFGVFMPGFISFASCRMTINNARSGIGAPFWGKHLPIIV